MISEPGFYPDLAEADYFTDPTPTPSLRQSLIKVLNGKSPYHCAFQHPRLNPYRLQNAAPTKFMRMGSAVHSLALGRGKEVSTIRHRDFKNSTARRAADLAIAAGRIPVLEHEIERATTIANLARGALDDYFEGEEWFPEVPFFWKEKTPFGEIWAAGMLDAFCPSLAKAADLKVSSVDATPDAVGRDMAKNGYDVQRAWYRRGLAALAPEHGEPFGFEHIYFEDQPPHGFSGFDLGESSDTTADLMCQRAAWRFAECLKARSWPSYPRHQRTDTPPYHQTAMQARLLAEEAH